MTTGVPRGPRVRRSVVAALLACLALLAPACSSDGGGDRTTVLSVLMTHDWVTPPFLDAVRDYERSHPGVKVQVDRAPISHMIPRVAAAARSGVPPDVVQAHAFSAAAQSLAQPVDDLWARSLERSEFLPGAVDDVTWAGRLYGVPLDTNALFLMYDTERLAAAGLPTPRSSMTFEEFEAMARALTTPDGERRAIAIPTSTWWTYGWIRANGGEVLEVREDGTVRLTLDAPEVVGALDFLARLVRSNVAFPPRAADSHSGDALNLFRTGSASVLASGSWDLSIITREPDGAKFATGLMPRGTDEDEASSVMGGSSMFVPTGSRNRELAFQFMTHLISDRYALRLAKEEGRLPVRPRVYRDPFFKGPELEAVLRQLRTATPFKLGAFPEAHEIFAAAIDEVLRTGREAGPVLADAQVRAQSLVRTSS